MSTSYLPERDPLLRGVLPPVSLGLWQHCHDVELVRAGFDRGMPHLDLANNYGPRPVPGRRP